MQLSFSMEREPPHPASFAAKGRPFILRFRYGDSRTAIPAYEGPLYRAGRNPTGTSGMFPIQPFAMSRAKFNPLILRVDDFDEHTAFQATKRADYLLPPRRLMLVQPAAMGIPPA